MSWTILSTSALGPGLGPSAGAKPEFSQKQIIVPQLVTAQIAAVTKPVRIKCFAMNHSPTAEEKRHHLALLTPVRANMSHLKEELPCCSSRWCLPLFVRFGFQRR